MQLADDISLNVVKTIINHPPNHHFLGGIPNGGFKNCILLFYLHYITDLFFPTSHNCQGLQLYMETISSDNNSHEFQPHFSMDLA